VIFSRAALAMNAERVRPCASAASSSLQQAGIDREIGLGGTTRVEQKRDHGEYRALGKCCGYLTVAPDGFDGARTRHGFTFGARVLSPQADSLHSIAQRDVYGLATRRAAGKIGHDDAVRAGLAVYECNITRHLLILLF
jgi:hypothetical protein